MDDVPRQDCEERRWQRRGDGEEKREDCDKLVGKRLKFGWMTYQGRTCEERRYSKGEMESS